MNPVQPEVVKKTKWPRLTLLEFMAMLAILGLAGEWLGRLFLG